MRKFFYARLAADNLKKNRRTYLPYLISCSVTCAMLYIICSLSMNDGLQNLEKGDVILPVILRIGTCIAMFFAAIFLFYTNSFLMKHRRKEFGLYQLLGMEKRHLARVLFFETVYTLLITMLFGLAAGMLLDKLMYMLVLRIMGGISDAQIPLGFSFNGFALLWVTAFFGIVFVLILLNAVRIVHFTKPVTMLSQPNAGEREPKTKLIMAILGVLLLAAGYIMSLRAKDSSLILKLMLPAVLSVIAGTYFLFMAGSIALLKLLKKNKSFYYKTRHFTAISGMIYRMKQNAVGLASICILSTMVLVMISSTTCMMIGMEELLHRICPREVVMVHMGPNEEGEQFVNKINQHLAAAGITPENPIIFEDMSGEYLFRDGKFSEVDYSDRNQRDQAHEMRIITAAYYTSLTGTEITLNPDEILLSSTEALTTLRRQTELNGFKFRIKQLFAPIPDLNMAEGGYVAVVSDLEVMKQYAKSIDRYIRYNYAFDMPVERISEVFGDERTRWENTALMEKLYYPMISARSEYRTLYVQVFGGLFFIALFLGFLFTVQMVLMIYYKQISEGHDDRNRYVIMQNVGMSLGEVRQTIRSQILTVFFLPIVTAAIHKFFCIPVIKTVLSEMELINLKLTYLILGITFIVFSILYALIYAATAKIYYRIVSSRTAEAA